jgi:tRNA A-37 threonylcarbamoyl transferase component Bud32
MSSRRSVTSVITPNKGVQIRDYILTERLSQTNMGQVWKAQDTMRKRTVALKMLRDDLVDDPEFRVRFLDEIERHCKLEHPHIVPVYDFFAEDNLVCMVMRCIDGQSLSHLLEAQGGRPLLPDTIVRISREVLGALDYAHQNGVVHRDVKPSNILLDREGNVYLIDFGISLAMGDIRKTRVGMVVGTPLYMSPEQVRTPRDVDQRTDVYSFGCVLFEMATGRPPFLPSEGEDPDFSVRQAHLTQKLTPARSLNPALPPSLARIIASALEKNADDRIPGCGEFRRLLEENGSAEPVRPAPKGRISTLLWIAPLALAAIACWDAANTTGPPEPSGWTALATIGHFVTALFAIAAAWNALADSASRMSGSKAAGFLLIPLWNLYWFPRVVIGYPFAYNAYLKRHGLTAIPPMSWVVPVLYVLSAYSLPFPLLASLSTRDRGLYHVAFLWWLAWMVLGAVFMAGLSSAIKKLKPAESGP